LLHVGLRRESGRRREHAVFVHDGLNRRHRGFLQGRAVRGRSFAGRMRKVYRTSQVTPTSYDEEHRGRPDAKISGSPLQISAT
jgi:hypothetical protein